MTARRSGSSAPPTLPPEPVAVLLAESDPAADRDDQGLADADQTASDADHDAAAMDQANADRDQGASDLDQDRSDRDRSTSGAWSTASEVEYRASQAIRKAGTSARLETGSQRTHTGAGRDDTAGHRDRNADARDEAARRAEALAARRLQSGRRVDLIKQVEALRAAVEAERARSAADRARAARDRARAAADRARAAEFRADMARERERLEAELRAAHLDVLTGAWRREAGDLALSQAVDRARRGDGQYIAVFVDVDRLKLVNDRAGHAAGDVVLQAVARTMREQVRSFDPVVRYGGDEFVCGLSAMSIADAEDRFDRIAARVREETGVELSVGLATLQPGDDLAGLLRRADAAMLLVKAAHHAIG